MKRVLDHDVISSFKEFFSHRFLNSLQGFKNVTTSLYPYSGGRTFVGKKIYASPYSQWVYDRSVSGVQIPSGIGSLNRGTSGLIFDFKNGRILVNSGVSITGSLNVSVPDFNIYVTTTSLKKIILENKFSYPPYLKPPTSAGKQESLIAPFIILSLTNTSSKPFELGGIESSNFLIQIGVLTDKVYDLMGVQKAVRDIARRVFPLVYTTPLNEYNDLKEGYWDYNEIKNFVSHSDLMYVNRTSFRILDSDFINDNHPNLRLGLGTVSISKYGVNSEYDDFIPYVDGDFSVYEFDD